MDCAQIRHLYKQIVSGHPNDHRPHQIRSYLRLGTQTWHKLHNTPKVAA